jgi:hypothetical protein
MSYTLSNLGTQPFYSRSSRILPILVLLMILNPTINSKKIDGSKCSTDDECDSQCCYEFQCTQTLTECEVERMNLLTRISQQINEDPELQNTVYYSTYNYYEKMKEQNPDIEVPEEYK